MIQADPSNFSPGSFYLMKNEKMIVFIQILERGNNYVTYSIKGTELDETTVCHAEEQGEINETSKALFSGEGSSSGLVKPGFLYALSPIKQVSFPLY